MLSEAIAYSGLSISTDSSFRGRSALLTSPSSSCTPELSVLGRSLPLGTLSTLGTRGTAGGLVVRVDAQSGLHHHHTVVTSVPAVFI